MNGWSIDLRPRPELRSSGAHPAVALTVFFAAFGFAVGLGSLFVR